MSDASRNRVIFFVTFRFVFQYTEREEISI